MNRTRRISMKVKSSGDGSCLDCQRRVVRAVRRIEKLTPSVMRGGINDDWDFGDSCIVENDVGRGDTSA